MQLDTKVFVIHHRDGVEMKYAAGEVIEIAPPLGDPPLWPENAIVVEYDDGTTEYGSSGAGLFLASGGYLVGVLSTGTPCGHDTTDYHGPLRHFLPQATRWLNPSSPPPPPPPPPPDDDHADDITRATVVEVPSSNAGNLERSGDLDHFRFRLPADGPLRVYTTGTTDTHGTLVDLTRRTRREDDDSGTNDNFRISCDQAPAGNYHVEVRGFVSGVTGVYALHIESALTPDSAYLAVPLVMDVSSTRVRGFVRITNLSDRAGSVAIHAVDDSGRRFYPVALSLDAGATAHFTSRDLEQGNPAKGISGGVGDGAGHWRLELGTDLDIEARAYIRSANETLTGAREVAAETMEGLMRYHAPFFNPASNVRFKSWLRLVNPGTEPATVTITGTDDAGNPPPEGEVRLKIPAGAARLLSAAELEQGAGILQGRLGDGEGKWQLQVDADRPLLVMSLVQDESGGITNLSR